MPRRCPDDMRPLPFCELPSAPASASAGPMNQNLLTFPNPSLVEQRLPRRECHYGNGSGVDMVNGLWLKSSFRFLDHHVFRMSAFTVAGAIRPTTDLIAFLELGNTRSNCFDNTGNIPHGNEGERQ